MTFEETKNNYLKGHSTWPYLDDDAALMFYRAGQEEFRKEVMQEKPEPPDQVVVLELWSDRIYALPLEGDDGES